MMMAGRDALDQMVEVHGYPHPMILQMLDTYKLERGSAELFTQVRAKERGQKTIGILISLGLICWLKIIIPLIFLEPLSIHSVMTMQG